MIELALELSDTAVAQPPVSTFKGYCAACGTWDEHGPSCVCCGYAFDREAEDEAE